MAAPPKYAVNRGIMIEGICGLVSGLVGAGHATTSYSSVMGFIGYTGVRHAFQLSHNSLNIALEFSKQK